MIAWRDCRDQAAATYLVKQFTPMMLRIAIRSLSCPWMAEDAVQIAWVKFFGSFDTFDTRIPISAWAVVVIKSVCLNIHRGLNRRPAIALDDLPYEVSDLMDPSPATDERCVLREKLIEIFQVISLLPAQDQIIMNSLFLEGNPPDEVARLTNLSTGALRVRTSRLRSRLSAMR